MKNIIACLSFIVCGTSAWGQQPKLILPIIHTEPVRSIAFSSDGKRIVTASYDNTAKLWDVESAYLLADFKGHTGYVDYAEFSPDGKKIVTVSHDSTAKIWDVNKGEIIATLKVYKNELHTAHFSPDGEKIITSFDDNTVRLWSVSTGKQIAMLGGKGDLIWYSYYSPDGKKIMTVSKDSVTKIRDAETRTIIGSVKGFMYRNDGLRPFSPDGKKFITTISQDYDAKIWNLETSNLVTILKATSDTIYNGSFSPDGNVVMTMSKNRIVKTWNALTGVMLANLGKTQYDCVPLFFPDGKHILIADYYGVKIMDAYTGTETARYRETDLIKSIKISPDGKRVYTLCDTNIITLWDISKGTIITKIKTSDRVPEWSPASFSGDGKKFAIISKGGIRIWNAITGGLIANQKGHAYQNQSVSLSPDEKKIVVAADNHTVKIWNIETGTLIAELKGHTNRVVQVSFSSDGKKILTASWDNTAKIWDAETGSLIFTLTGHKDDVTSARYSFDGRKIITASNDKTGKIWDAETGNLVTSLPGHEQYATDGYLSQDGKRALTFSSYIGNAKIWDAETGALIMDFESTKLGAEWITSANLSFDGKKAIIGYYYGLIKIFDVDKKMLAATLKGHSSEIEKILVNTDGKKIATISKDNTGKIWNSGTGVLISNFKIPSYENIRDAEFSTNCKRIITESDNFSNKLWDAETGKELCTYFTVDSGYLVVDKDYRFDGTEATRKLLYFTCGTEIVALDQVKDQLWVPNLFNRKMKGDSINAKKLSNIDICGLIPEVQETGDGLGKTFQYIIRPRRGGIGETILYVNGIETKHYQPNELIKQGDNYELKVSYDDLKDNFLPGQKNTVSVKSYTSKNDIGSRGVTVTVADTKKVTTPPNLYAVMIGVSDYKGPELHLQYAAKDAKDISAAIKASAGTLLGKDHVFTYNLTTDKDHYLQPEKEGIRKTLEDIGRKTKANDILLIFFAGHGVMNNKNGQFYFLTADASNVSATESVGDAGISARELTDWIQPSKIKAQKRILILDACNSGQAINDIVRVGQAGEHFIAARDDEKAQQIKAIDKLNEKSGLLILCASASNQSAYEFGRYSQGLLTYALLKAIKQHPEILDDNQKLNVEKWFIAAKKIVNDIAKDNGARQDPQKVGIGDDFFIGVVNNDVVNSIHLSEEKPLFTSSNFQNSDAAIADDNLGLSHLIDHKLMDISTRGTGNSITYITYTNTPDVWTINGRYTVTGNNVTVTANVRYKGEIKYRVDVTGDKNGLEALAQQVAEQAIKKAGIK